MWHWPAARNSLKMAGTAVPHLRFQWRHREALDLRLARAMLNRRHGKRADCTTASIAPTGPMATASLGADLHDGHF